MADLLSQIESLLGGKTAPPVQTEPVQPYRGNAAAQPNQRELPRDTLERLRQTYLGPGKSWTSENYREPMAAVNTNPDSRPRYQSGGLVQHFADAGKVRSIAEILAEKVGQVDARLSTGTFSPAARGIAAAPQYMTGQQWQNFLKNRQVDVGGQKFPVRPDEVEFTGLGKLLEGKRDETVPRGALLDYLRGAGRMTGDDEEVFQRYVTTGRPKDADEAKRWDEVLRKRIMGNNDARHPDENTLVSPDTFSGTMDEDLMKVPHAAGEVQYPEANYQLPGAKTDYREELTHYEPISKQWSANHFADDDMNEGLVSHSRVSSRKTADGRPVVHVDEIQSDLHQTARNEGGYQDPNRVATWPANELPPRYSTYRSENDGTWGVEGDGGAVLHGRPDRETAIADFNRIHGDAVRHEYNDGKPPRAPYQDRYHEVEFNKALRRAVQEDADHVTWTTGKQQADRFGGDKEEGMSNFYDRTVKKFAEQWARRFPGAEVGQVDLGSGFSHSRFKPEFQANFSANYNGPMRRYIDAVVAGNAEDLATRRELVLKDLRQQMAQGQYNTTPSRLDRATQEDLRNRADVWLNDIESLLKDHLKEGKNQVVHSLKLTPDMKAWIKQHGTPVFSTAGAAAVGGSELLDQIDGMLEGKEPRKFADGGAVTSDEDVESLTHQPSHPAYQANADRFSRWSKALELPSGQDLLMTPRGNKMVLDLIMPVGESDNPWANAGETLTGLGFMLPGTRLAEPVANLVLDSTKQLGKSIGKLWKGAATTAGVAALPSEAEANPLKEGLKRTMSEIEMTHLPTGTFSPAARAIASAPQDMTGQQWQQFLKSRQVDVAGQKFPVRPDELEFTELGDLLKRREGETVSRGALLDYLRGTGNAAQGYPEFKILGAGQEHEAQYRNYQLTGPSDVYRENLTVLPGLDYEAPHFGDSGNNSGLISWSRTSERPLTTGEKATHIDEIQSDLHQQGRDRGYRQPPAPRDPAVEQQYQQAHDEAQAKWGEQARLRDDLRQRLREVYDQQARLAVDLNKELLADVPGATPEDVTHFIQDDPGMQALTRLSEQLQTQINGIPLLDAEKAATRARILRDAEPQHRQAHLEFFEAADAKRATLDADQQAQREVNAVRQELAGSLKRQRDAERGTPELAQHEAEVEQASKRLAELQKLDLDDHPALKQEQRVLQAFTYGYGRYLGASPGDRALLVNKARREIKGLDDAIVSGDGLDKNWYRNEKAIYEAQLRGLRYQPNPELEAKLADVSKRRQEAADAHYQAADNYTRARERLDDIQADTHDERRPPRAPYQDRYHEVEFNKALKAAADAGHDVVTWTPGEVQAKRWSQSIQDQVKKLELVKEGPVPVLRVTPLNGTVQKYPDVGNGQYETPQGIKSLEEILGRSMADKLVKQGSLEGDSLSLGGGGFKNFYDDKLGKHAESWARRFPGTKVDQVELAGPSGGKKLDQAWFNNYAEDNPAWLDVSPQLVEDTLLNRVSDRHLLDTLQRTIADAVGASPIASLQMAKDEIQQLRALHAQGEVPLVEASGSGTKVHSLRLSPELKAWVKQHGIPVMGVTGAVAVGSKDNSTLDQLLDDVARGKHQVPHALEALR